MSDPTICPDTRLRCGSPELCWLIHCSKQRVQTVKMRPIHERELTKEELYRLWKSEQPA